MVAPVIPNLPDVTGKTVSDDQQLKELLIAIKITLEKITGSTAAELDELLAKND